jgi:hypothetical protein
MPVEIIDDPLTYLNSFSLHDVRVHKISLCFESQTVEFVVEDLNWNYEGSPGYIEKPCSIIFEGVVGHFIDILDLEGVRFDQNRASAVNGLTRVEFDLNEGGGDSSWGKDRSSICLTFKSMKIVDR